MSGFLPYTPVYGCGNDGPGAANLLYWIDRESPWAGSVYNLGVCACRGTGSGATSQHARCRACDAGIKTLAGGRPNLAVGNPLVAALRAKAGELGLTEIIWNRTRWSALSPDGRYYTGVSPHYDHVHIALSLTATRNLNVPTIRAVMRGLVVVNPPPTPPPTTTPNPPKQEDEEDMAATIRLNAPGHKDHGRVEQVTAMHRRWIPGNEYALYTFLGGQTIQCDLAQFNSWTSNKQAVGTNGINGPL